MKAPVPARARPAVTRRLRSAGLDGGALSVRAWLLLIAGTAGGLVFTGVYLAEGAARAGYRALAQPISALSLGPGGWVQQLNFIVFGMLVCASAAGWRAALSPGRGAAAFPVLRVAAGVGLVMDGLFSQDPSGGYPPGAQAAAATVHGQVHTLFAMITITARVPSAPQREHPAGTRRKDPGRTGRPSPGPRLRSRAAPGTPVRPCRMPVPPASPRPTGTPARRRR